MSKYKEILVPGDYFHVFNRAVGNEKLFLIEDNYYYFLNLFQKYISPVSDLFSYSLLPNHFHFFLRFKNSIEIFKQMELVEYRYAELNMQPKFLLQQFSNFFNSYTKSFNFQFGRKGKLFIEPFCRRSVSNPGYYTKLVHYVHSNSVHHGLSKKVESWPYSSYHSIVKEQNNFVKADEVIKWFGSVDSFVKFHDQPVLKKTKSSLIYSLR
jgi:putative transposase